VIKNNRSANGRGVLLVLAVLAALLLIGTVVVSWKRWEGQPPSARFDRDFKALGRSPSLSLTVEDPGTGLRSVSVVLRQKDQSIPLVEQQYLGPSFLTFWRTGVQKSANFDIGKLIKEKFQIQEGPASLSVSASDYALRNFFR